MPIPNQSLFVLDPGLGTTEPATNIPLVIGQATNPSKNAIRSYSRLSDLAATEGEGDGVETAAYVLQIAGGPVRFLAMTTSIAATTSAVSPSRVGTSTGTLTLSGTPNATYRGRWQVVKTGTLGTAEFEYSLDDGKTYSAALLIPSGGAFVVPNTGLTVTFAAGAGPVFFERGDVFTFTTTAAMWNATDLAAAMTAIQASNVGFDVLFCAGKHATAATAATIFAALDTHLTNLANQFRFIRAIIDGGADTTTNWLTAFSGVSSRRIGVTYGDHEIASAKAFAGFAFPRLPILVGVAGRAARIALSTDAGRVADGPVPGVLSITHDEWRNEVIDAARGTTMRTLPTRGSEIYITNLRLKSPAGSDFKYWQHGRIMDVACRTVVDAQLNYLNASFRTNDDGTIDERDAVRIETNVEAQLRSQLTEPKNAEGTQGHVSDLRYRVDRSVNLLTTETLVSEVAIRPRGYAKFISTTLGFAAQISPVQA